MKVDEPCIKENTLSYNKYKYLIQNSHLDIETKEKRYKSSTNTLLLKIETRILVNYSRQCHTINTIAIKKNKINLIHKKILEKK